MTRRKLISNKTKKIYGKDRIIPYNIHKVTLISFDPLLSCKTLKKIFGDELSEIHSPPDKALKERGIKWIRFLSGGKAEIHFVPPFHLKYYNSIANIVAKEDKQDPLKTPFFENHVGIYVPNLTPIVIKTIKLNIPFRMNRREDGLYQFYIDIPVAIDYLEIDSEKFQNKNVNIHIHGFKENTKLYNQMVKSQNTHTYTDPKHHNAPRTIKIKKDGTIVVFGKDNPNEKVWKIKGNLKDGYAIFDFTPKGGPKNIKAIITPNKVTFDDGNVWKIDEKKIYNLL